MLDQDNMIDRVDSFPLRLQAHGATGVINPGVEQWSTDDIGRRSGVEERALYEDILAAWSGDGDLAEIVEGRGEGLEVSVKLFAKALLSPLQHEIR